uniref:UBA domain-containing protein n=1 Tax=Lactuca sativa TaxID=4236 RepID=A0A9R1X9A9_LACSA|nr:hypothetical protein LSAT_V11C600314880 [Lactuca sativa]
MHVQMHEKYDEEVDCGIDEHVFIVNLTNKELHIANNGFQGDAGEAWIICRWTIILQIVVSKEDGCLLESANGNPIFVLRKSELVPINGIDSRKIKITPKQTQTEQIDDGIAEDVEESKRTKEVKRIVLGSAMADVVIDAMIAEAARREKWRSFRILLANLSSWLPRREVAPQSAEENSRFPARGRTLGATQIETVSNNASPNSTLQTKLLESGNRPVYPSTQEATGGINTDATAAVSVVSDEEIQKLVAMGFDKEAHDIFGDVNELLREHKFFVDILMMEAANKGNGRSLMK